MSETFAYTPTNWDHYDLPRMWDVIRSERRENSDSHLNAWYRMAEVLSDHASKLRTAANHAERLWEGPASHLYVTKLRTLAQALDDAARVADGNARHLEALIGSIEDTRNRIQPLVEKRDRLIAQINGIRAGAGQVLGPLGDFIAEQGGEVVLWWEVRDLERQARTIMREGDESARAATFRQPAVYTVPETEYPKPPPPTEPPRHQGGYRGGGASVGGGSGWTLPSVEMPPFPPPPEDPILSGGTAPDVPGSPGMPGVPSTGPVGPGSGPGIPGAGGIPPLVGPGGVIGGRTPSGSGLGPGHPGGLIGPGGTIGAARPTGTSGAAPAGAGAHVGGMLAPPVIGGSRSGAAGGKIGDRRGRRNVDPDDPWQVEQGNPAVISAPPEPGPEDFNPGPGVIGIDR